MHHVWPRHDSLSRDRGPALVGSTVELGPQDQFDVKCVCPWQIQDHLMVRADVSSHSCVELHRVLGF
jgi:hypothetical protein